LIYVKDETVSYCLKSMFDDLLSVLTRCKEKAFVNYIKKTTM